MTVIIEIPIENSPYLLIIGPTTKTRATRWLRFNGCKKENGAWRPQKQFYDCIMTFYSHGSGYTRIDPERSIQVREIRPLKKHAICNGTGTPLKQRKRNKLCLK